MTELEEAIQSSKDHILGLKDNWDEEGAKPFKKETVDRAIQIIRMVHKEVKVKPPNLSPYGNGAVDIHWNNDYFELLLDVEEDPKEPMGYFGDTYPNKNKDIEIEREFTDIKKEIPIIVAWMKRCMKND